MLRRTIGDKICNHSQESEAEYPHEEQLLLPGETKMPKYGQRKCKDGDVGGNISRRIHIPLRLVRDAISLDGLVPEPFDGYTGEGSDEKLGNGPCSNHDDCDSVNSPHLRNSHDSVILEQKRQFYTEKRNVVEDDGDKEGLESRVSEHPTDEI